MTAYKLHTITFTKAGQPQKKGLFCYAKMSLYVHLSCHFVCFEKIGAKCYDFKYIKGENVWDTKTISNPNY